MGENYTAEEYRETLLAIYKMNSEEREKVFGLIPFIFDFAKNYQASELIEKYRAYSNTPKTGEYWKRKTDGEMIVVRRVEKDIVYLYICDGGCSHILSLKCFTDNYTKTEHKSQYLELFIKEMEKVSK